MGIFKDVDEVKVALGSVVITECLEPVKKSPHAMHLAISGKSKKSIVIEFVKGKTTICDNPRKGSTKSNKNRRERH